jgi:hypothetical protein
MKPRVWLRGAVQSNEKQTSCCLMNPRKMQMGDEWTNVHTDTCIWLEEKLPRATAVWDFSQYSLRWNLLYLYSKPPLLYFSAILCSHVISNLSVTTYHVAHVIFHLNCNWKLTSHQSFIILLCYPTINLLITSIMLTNGRRQPTTSSPPKRIHRGRAVNNVVINASL